MVWVCSLPCPGGVRRGHLQPAAFPKEFCTKATARKWHQGRGLSQGGSVPSLRGIASCAEQGSKPKVMEPAGDSASRVKYSVLDKGNASQWQQLPKRQKCLRIILFTTDDIFSDTLRMPWMYRKYRKSHSFCYHQTKDTRVTFRNDFFKNILHNFQDFCLLCLFWRAHLSSCTLNPEFTHYNGVSVLLPCKSPAAKHCSAYRVQPSHSKMANP